MSYEKLQEKEKRNKMASREKTESVSSKSSCNMHVIFRFADWIDIILMVLGTVGAIGDGMSTNVALVFASKIMNSLGYGQHNPHSTTFKDEVQKVSHLLVHNKFQEKTDLQT